MITTSVAAAAPLSSASSTTTLKTRRSALKKNSKISKQQQHCVPAILIEYLSSSHLLAESVLALYYDPTSCASSKVLASAATVVPDDNCDNRTALSVSPETICDKIINTIPSNDQIGLFYIVQTLLFIMPVAHLHAVDAGILLYLFSLDGEKGLPSRSSTFISSLRRRLPPCLCNSHLFTASCTQFLSTSSSLPSTPTSPPVPPLPLQISPRELPFVVLFFHDSVQLLIRIVSFLENRIIRNHDISSYYYILSSWLAIISPTLTPIVYEICQPFLSPFSHLFSDYSPQIKHQSSEPIYPLYLLSLAYEILVLPQQSHQSLVPLDSLLPTTHASHMFNAYICINGVNFQESCLFPPHWCTFLSQCCLSPAVVSNNYNVGHKCEDGEESTPLNVSKRSILSHICTQLMAGFASHGPPIWALPWSLLPIYSSPPSLSSSSPPCLINTNHLLPWAICNHDFWFNSSFSSHLPPRCLPQSLEYVSKQPIMHVYADTLDQLIPTIEKHITQFRYDNDDVWDNMFQHTICDNPFILFCASILPNQQLTDLLLSGQSLSKQLSRLGHVYQALYDVIQSWAFHIARLYHSTHIEIVSFSSSLTPVEILVVQAPQPPSEISFKQ